MKFSGIMESPIGKIGIRLQGTTVTEITWLTQKAVIAAEENSSETVIKALKKYFIKPQHQFDLSLEPAGTDFQKRVWRALCEIPAGTTLTYGELAKKLKSSPRAVGQACKRNPIAVIIPCHRVISSTGLGGYMGRTTGINTDIKQWLLKHESRAI